MRANHQCEYCGRIDHLNVHHIIGKRYAPLRYNKMNSIVLCPKCHKFGIGYAAHENPIKLVRWLMEHRPLVIKILSEVG